MLARNLFKILSQERSILGASLSQIYSACLTLITLPMLLDALGKEGFGLAGVVASIQAWFFLLDFGRVALITRESAGLHYSSELNAYLTLCRNSRNLIIKNSSIFALLLIIFVQLNGFGRSETEKIVEVDYVIVLLLVIFLFSVRLLSEIPRAILIGRGCINWISLILIFSATSRTIGVIFFLNQIAGNPFLCYLVFQIAVSTTEYIALQAVKGRIIQNLNLADGAVNKVSSRFAWQMSFSALIWIIVSQLDKLFLVGLLSVTEYGTYSLVVALSGGILLLLAPFNITVPIRLTSLRHADSREWKAFYMKASRRGVLFLAGITVVLCLCPEYILYIWTNELQLSQAARSLLIYYSLGNFCLAISAFPYFLEFSSGDVRRHILGSIIFATSLSVLILYYVNLIGMDGAGIAWCIVNVLYLFAYVPFIHIKHGQGCHSSWLIHQIAPPVIGALLGAIIWIHTIETPDGRIPGLLWIAGVLAMSYAFSFASSILVERLKLRFSWEGS